MASLENIGASETSRARGGTGQGDSSRSEEEEDEVMAILALTISKTKQMIGQNRQQRNSTKRDNGKI